MTSVGDTGGPSAGELPDPPVEGAAAPLESLDPVIIHRVRALNASALRVMDGMLDMIADRSGRS
jgi:hypothetical protein